MRGYEVKDPKTVATIVKSARVVGILNDLTGGITATAIVTAHFPNGRTFRTKFDLSANVFCDGGILRLDKGFFDALNRAVGEDAKTPVDLCQFVPDTGEVVLPERKASPKSLESGFARLSLTYQVGGRLHQSTIDDAPTLADLHKALVVVRTAPVAKDPAESRKMIIKCKDGTIFDTQIQSRESFVDLGVGRFVVTPKFFEAVNKEVSRRAGFEIDVSANNNAIPPKLKERSDRFLKLLAEVKTIRVLENHNGEETGFRLDVATQVTQVVASLSPVEAAPRDLKLRKQGRRLELTLKDGKTVTLTFLDTGADAREAETVAAVPVLSDLVEVVGFGQLWVATQLWTRLRDLNYFQMHRAKVPSEMETARLVCRDLPTFYKLVLGGGVKEANTVGVLSEAETRAVLAALAAGRFEALDWTAARWRKELGDRGGLELELSPGLGFSLNLFVKGEKEVYIPRIGRITFKENPIPAIRKAIDEKKPARPGNRPDDNPDDDEE